MIEGESERERVSLRNEGWEGEIRAGPSKFEFRAMMIDDRVVRDPMKEKGG